MHIEFLVEEPSAEEALKVLVPAITAGCCSFAIRTYQGKQQLLSRLANRLRGYRAWITEDYRIVVLIDEDRQDCSTLKGQLEAASRSAGLTTKSSCKRGKEFQVLNRVAVEELEAWFLGDVEALREAFPRVPAGLKRRKTFRDPDAVPGGTAEALRAVLQRAGYFRRLKHLPKQEIAKRISKYMDPQRNRSKSFQVFRDGLLEMIRCETQTRSP